MSFLFIISSSISIILELCSIIAVIFKKLNAHQCIEMAPPLVLMFWSIMMNFLVCECGEQLSTRFTALSDTIWHSDWYKYPIEVQRMLPTIMINLQQQTDLQGFGNVLCTREIFKKVRFLKWLLNICI